MSTALATPTNGQVVHASPTQSLLQRLGDRFGVDAEKMLGTLKATAFRQKDKDGKTKEVTNEQMMALLIVADQYHLNPWTKEIYAFPQDGGIVPIVGVDGWIRMMNEHPQFDGIEFVDGPEVGEKPNLVNEWIECTIHRKDRAKPIKVREYVVECRNQTGPWQSHPRRMLRHKALIQACRVAFGFAGIYDEDEASTLAETRVMAATPPPNGRVHHVNRITSSPAAAAPVEVSKATEPAAQEEYDPFQSTTEDDQIKRQELVDHLNEVFDGDCTSSQLDEAGLLLTKNATVLGDCLPALQQRYSQVKERVSNGDKPSTVAKAGRSKF